MKKSCNNNKMIYENVYISILFKLYWAINKLKNKHTSSIFSGSIIIWH
jgi:hypothetical protein